MKSKKLVAAACATATLALTASACSSSSSGGSAPAAASVLSTAGAGKTVNIWIMQDAEKGWPKVVSNAVSAFEAATGAKVNITWTTWANYTTKIQEAIKSGGSNEPDAVEVGDTDMGAFIADHEFQDLSSVKSQFDNSSTWLTGLTQSVTGPNGDIYGIPYYAGDRVGIYNTKIWSGAGITSPPTTLTQLASDAAAIKAKYPNDVPMYIPGEDWYVALGFVFGAGGNIATYDNSTQQWTANLESSQAEAGLTEWKTLQAYSNTASQTTDETTQDAVMAVGNVGTIFGAGWEAGSVTSATGGGNPALTNYIQTFAVPGATAGSVTPTFLGGSDMAIPANAPEAGLGAEFVKYFTDNASDTALAAFAMPNTTSLMSTFEATSAGNKIAGEAAAGAGDSWVTPTAPGWATVEAQNVLQDMLESIATGKSTVAAAAATADQAIDADLNAP